MEAGRGTAAGRRHRRLSECLPGPCAVTPGLRPKKLAFRQGQVRRGPGSLGGAPPLPTSDPLLAPGGGSPSQEGT